MIFQGFVFLVSHHFVFLIILPYFPNGKIITRVPQALWCPPRGWPAAGVGVGMLRGRGVLGLLRSWFLDFLVSSFLVFSVSWFQSVLVSRFQSSLVSKFQRFNDPILPTLHFMLQADFDPIRQISKIHDSRRCRESLRRILMLFCARLFNY